jgi:hypothetical protein
MVNLAKSAWQSVKNFFGISSPSKLMRDSIGKFIPEGMAVGIEANADEVYDAMDKLSQVAMDPFDNMPVSDFPGVNTQGNAVGDVINNTFNIYPSEGMDEEQLARKVEEKLVEFTNRRKAVFA